MTICSRQEDISNLALTIANDFVLVFWLTSVAHLHTAGLGRAHMDGNGTRLNRTDGARRRRCGGFRKRWEKKFVHEARRNAVGNEVLLVVARLFAALEHDLDHRAYE